MADGQIKNAPSEDNSDADRNRDEEQRRGEGRQPGSRVIAGDKSHDHVTDPWLP
jgi:hypothetical protein